VINEMLPSANLGFDGSWVVHPLLVETAQKCFNSVIMSSVNQKQKLPEISLFEILSFINSKVGEEYDIIV
jgi:malate synthase